MNQLLPTIVRTLVAAATLSAAALTAHAQGVTGDAQAGQKKADMCIGCHGIPGYQNSFPEIHKVPMISGQSDKYIVSALTAYKKGDRKHPSMRGIAGSLSEQDMADLAAFYASQTDKTATETPRTASTAAAALIEKGACASCHGANFSKPIDPSYPKLGGQHADYLFVALKSYTVEGNTVVGRSNGIMAGIAKQYSTAEMREIAKYLASVEGELKIVPQSRFR
ncbi:MAG: c-type cytochrome [Hydrogenophaga sp.]|jgi:cytochrome c553|uniref:c-type cytochrome n=1 Tax=Hydrogenophaga sp. TaxID=1904254 RepID=UPI00271ABEAB|nr:c-type cytochrome [Hydrogenophaga sp.]MDO9482376.1 c-type cytochrome [Hydrogenophaga sp.]MDP2221892.1 c-type cytochrome [Hydrogenophaga sp.]MDP3345951.1 c-type cytochrome [Hydrogenophaga sp.]MDP3807467.1 c-type cytochrome [Hydrogenophaga sp.]MDP3925623.1 c-type cytochrome [Hydrogenophaga sp.]